MGLSVQANHSKIVLLAFSNSRNAAGVVPAGRIFEELMQNSIWYAPRRSRDLVQGATVLFYQAGSGARGHAQIVTVADATATEQPRLHNYGLYHLSVKLHLTDIVLFARPVTLAPIVSQLEFVANKRYWGHSLRSTPRSITFADFRTIVAAAQT